MGSPKRPPKDRTGRSAELRDLLVVALASVVVFGFGVLSGVFRWLDLRLKAVTPSATTDVLVTLLVIALGSVAFAARRRRQADREQALRAETERRYRAVIEQVPAITYTWDPTKPLGEAPPVYLSPQVETLLGYAPAEWIDDPGLWVERVHPDDRDRVLAASEEADRTGAPFLEEYRMYAKDGRLVWIRDEAVTVERSSDGRPTLSQGVMYDITRQKVAEERLGAAQERYRALVETLPVVTYVSHTPADGRERLRYVAPGIVQLTGHEPSECVDDPRFLESLIHPDDRDRVMELSRQSDRTGEPFEAEYRIVRKDGQVAWIRDVSVVAHRDEDGFVWQGVFEDVTRRHQVEQLLREAEERFRTLVESLPIVVFLEKPGELGAPLYMSPQYERLTGYTAEQRLNDPGLWEHMLHPDDRDRVLEESRRTDETEEPFDIEYRLVVADGRVIWVHELSHLVTGSDGNPVWQGVLTDITERKLAQEAVGRRDRILEAAGHAAERFLNERTWTDCIDDVLRRLGEAGGASRAFVYENTMGPTGEVLTACRFGWSSPEAGASPTPGGGEPLPYLGSGFARWEEILSAGGVIHGPVCDYPGSERRVLEAANIKSCIAVPVFAGDQWWGYVGFEDCCEERDWQPAEIDAVRVAANTLGAAIRRERAAQRLAETQARYRTLIEQIPAVTYMTPVGGGSNLYVSPQIEGVFGYTPDEWTNDVWRSSIHEDDAERILRLDRIAYETEEPFAAEYRIRTRDGRALWVRDEATLVRDDTGAPLYWQGVRFDITNQKETEDQLRSAEERYRSLIETIPAATYIDTVDAVSKAVYMSPQVVQIFGYTPDEWRADPELWQRGVHPDDLAGVLERIERLNTHGEPYEAEYRFRRPDGRTVWVQDQAVVIRDESGHPVFSQGVMYDVTERKETEAQLRDAEERFRAIVEHVPWAVYLDAPGGSPQSLYVSPQIQQVTGISPEEWMAGTAIRLEAVHPDDREGLHASYRSALEEGRPWSGEYRIVHRDGRTIWVHDETTFLHDEAGRPRLIQGVIADITERKLAEQTLRDSEQREREAAERLRALDEMKNTFLAAVSHELRSPLTSILGLALTLERAREMGDDDRDDLLQRLASNARKLDRLLKDLLDIDRLNRGIVEPQYRVTDVGALAARTVESVEALADRAVLVDVEPVVLSIDPAKVERILENLLMNAVRHTTEDRRIWVRVEAQDGGALIVVEDDGPGVPGGLRSAIFEPFRQGPSASAHSPGTGIGLSLVSRFAALHEGRAWVQDREGGGASFRVFLPPGPAERASGDRGTATLSVAEAG